ncbi:hypothetical protein PGT21_007624 [Puccinia graminis f. sp. tritici]|uniref:Uncharacterized protein n=1 Tax=Puccinia graminis f. sp. tritici TaxID=56615 RepID=A0A5B0S0Z1_PUCGR|nr:hypothetical protein PGT21_007624 [Puccinia graminis f. sp. tritici]KAA1131408.1 hypothetical protein PGTUg99_004560 [Puccinia graminis f. sp. tritici]
MNAFLKTAFEFKTSRVNMKEISTRERSRRVVLDKYLKIQWQGDEAQSLSTTFVDMGVPFNTLYASRVLGKRNKDRRFNCRPSAQSWAKTEAICTSTCFPSVTSAVSIPQLVTVNPFLRYEWEK